MKKDVKISLRLPEEFLNELEQIQETNNEKSLSHTVRNILIDFLNTQRDQNRLKGLESRLMQKLNHLESLLVSETNHRL